MSPSTIERSYYYSPSKANAWHVRENRSSYSHSSIHNQAFQRAFIQLQIAIERLGAPYELFSEKDCEKVMLMTRALSEYKREILSLQHTSEDIANGSE